MTTQGTSWPCVQREYQGGMLGQKQRQRAKERTKQARASPINKSPLLKLSSMLAVRFFKLPAPCCSTRASPAYPRLTQMLMITPRETATTRRQRLGVEDSKAQKTYRGRSVSE